MSFNFNKILSGITSQTNNVTALLSKLSSAGSSGSVSLAVMFKLQFAMQVLAQYIEASANTLTAAHNEMLTMAKATKGQ